MVLPYRCTGRGPWKLREDFEKRRRYRQELQKELEELAADEIEWDRDRKEVESSLVGLVHEASLMGEAAEKERKLFIELQNTQLKNQESLLHNIRNCADRESAEKDMAYSVNLANNTPGKEHEPFFGKEARSATYQEAIMHALSVNFDVGTPTASETTAPGADGGSVESLNVPPVGEVFEGPPSSQPLPPSATFDTTVFENTHTTRLSPDPTVSLSHPTVSSSSLAPVVSSTLAGSCNSLGRRDLSAFTTPQDGGAVFIEGGGGGTGYHHHHHHHHHHQHNQRQMDVFSSQPPPPHNRPHPVQRMASYTPSTETNLPFTTASQFSPEDLPVFGGRSYSVASPTPSASLPSPASGIWMSSSSL